MPLERQVISFPLAQGLDTKSDVKQLSIGKMSDMLDCVFTTGGELRKRNGNSPLSGSVSTVGNAGMCGSFKNEILAANQNTCYSYSSSGPEWVSKGAIESFEISSNPVIRGLTSPTSNGGVTSAMGPDSAYNQTYGFSCHTFALANLRPVYYYFLDQSTGSVVLNSTITCTSANGGVRTAPMHPVAIGKYILIFYTDTATTIQYQAFDCTTQTISAPVSVATDKTAANVWSVTYSSRLSRVYVTWWNGTVVKGKYLDTSLVQTASSSNVTVAGLTKIDIASDITTTNTLPVTYYNTTDVRMFSWNDNMSSVVMADTSVETIANIVQLTLISYGGFTSIFYTQSASNSYNFLTKVTVTQPSGSVVGTPAVYQRSCSISSKPFLVTSIGQISLSSPQLHICLFYSDTQQPTYFVAYSQYPSSTTAPTSTIVGKYAQNLATPVTYALAYGNGPPPQVSVMQTGYKFLVTQVQLNDATNLFNATAGAEYFIFDWGGASSIPQIWNKTEDANNLMLSGGFPWMYDGVNLVEHNFHLYPYAADLSVANSTIQSNNSGGSLTDNGVYQFILTYEWMDAQGQQHRSFPSSTITVTAANSGTNVNSIVFQTGGAVGTIPTLRLTQKGQFTVQIGVYRTTAGGTTFYKDSASSHSSQLSNNTAVDAVSYTSTISDANLQLNEQLYTQTQLDNSAAPACGILTTFKERVVAVPSEENVITLWLSQSIIPGAPVEFSPFLTWPVSTVGGKITAAQQMDDKFIIFKKNAIFYMFGDGPSALGANNDWTTPVQVPCNVGAVSQRAVVLTPLGIIFQSQQGFYLLDRSLQVSYIGADVEAYNALPTYQVTTCRLLPNSTMVKFCLNSTNYALIYDFYYKQWSKFTNHGANDSCVFQDLFTFAANSTQTGTNGVWQETPGTYTDNSGNTSYNLQFVTGWISFSKIQNFQRVRRVMMLGDFESNCTFHVQVSYDYGANNDTGSMVLTGGILPFNLMYYIPQQKTEAIQINMYENNDSGEGVRFSNLAFEVGIKKGFYKTPAANRIG